MEAFVVEHCLAPNNFLVQINDLQTPCPTFKYVDDSTIFDVCNNTSVPMLQ